MKKISVLFTLFVFAICLNAQHFNLTGAGARAAGMGGAFIGVADDATAIVWNPAGLSQLMRPEASVVTRFINDGYTYNFFGEEEKESQSHFVLNFLSGALPFTIGSMKVVGALAFQRQVDLYNYYKYEDEEYEGIGGVDTATLGAGIQLMPILSAGFSTNFWFGNYEYTENYRADYKYEESYSGLNFVFGIMADFNNLDAPLPLKLGVTYRTPFDLEVDWDEEEGDGSFTVEMPTMIGFGASFRVGEFLTFAGDYEMRTFSESKIIEEGIEADLTEFDLNQFRLGAEYLLVTDFAVIPIRAGFFNYPTLESDWEWDDEFQTFLPTDDQIVGTGFSIGSGLIFEKFAFDVTFSGWQYEVNYGEIFDEDITMEVSNATISASAILYFE